MERRTHNQITGPNAGGPRQFPIRTSLTACVGQFYRCSQPTMHAIRLFLRLSFTLCLGALMVSCGKIERKAAAIRSATEAEVAQAFSAVATNDVAGLKKMADAGVSMDISLPDGKTLLAGAAATGRREALVFLISSGCSVTNADRRGMTPLHWASFYGRTNVIEPLVDAGADINGREASGMTPLHCAATGDDLNTVRLLLKHGAKTDLKDGFGATAAAMAEQNGKSNIAATIHASEKP
jgi:hypothetical protein